MGFFDSDAILFAISILEIIMMILIGISALVYILSICCFRVTRSYVNTFTINFSLAALFFSTFYLAYYGVTFRDDYYTVIFINGCNLLYYLGPMANCSVVYSLGAVSVNRLCMVVFHTTRIFKTNGWAAICVTGAWILAILIPLPNLTLDRMLCVRRMLPYWHNIYALLMIVLVPTLVFGITNLIIFNHVRNSTKRTWTEQQSNRRRFALSRRDVKLVKNMLLMFLLFTIGWAPIYIFRLTNFPPGIVRIRLDFGLTLLPVTSLLVNMIILYYHHQELRDNIDRLIRKQPVHAPQRTTTANNRNMMSMSTVDA